MEQTTILIGMQIGIRALILWDDGADDGCERQREQQHNGQLDGTKKIPQWVRVLQKQLLLIGNICSGFVLPLFERIGGRMLNRP
ncbi:MAG: hypothetical protein HGJ94_05895 [Desulfosarcina sp.]|nr:hypothetical protein [Desulfosarcina sp.]